MIVSIRLSIVIWLLVDDGLFIYRKTSIYQVDLS